MHVEERILNPLLERTGERFAKNGVGNSIDPKLITEYRELLDVIAGKHAYRVGEAIEPDDLTRIKAKVESILKNMSNGIANVPFDHETDRVQYHCFGAMVAVTDHLFAMALKALGDPDMPPSFGSEIQEKIKTLAQGTELVLKQSHYKKLNVERHFRSQRKRPAKTVKKSNLATMLKIKNQKEVSPLELGTLVAEYRALKQRQDGHTFIWRFFHGTENGERVALLGTMKKFITTALETNVDVDKLDPVNAADMLNKKNIDNMAKEAFRDEGIAKRYYFLPESIMHEPVSFDDVGKQKDGEVPSPLEANALDTVNRESIAFEAGEIEGEQKVELAPPVNEVPKKDEITLIQ